MSPNPTPRRLAFAAAAAALLASACSRAAGAASASPEDAALPVRLAPVAPGPVERPIRAAGVLAAKSEWDLAFKVGGVLSQLRVDEGAPVRAGQVLAELDTTELGAAVSQAREALRKARRDAERATTLAAQDAVPRAAAEDARTGLAVAEAAAAAAEFNLRHARLVAPDDGWVDRRLAEPGEIVAPGRPVLHLSGRGRGYVVRAALAERDVLGLAPGAAATVTLDANPGIELAGRVTEIGHAAARGTGTWQVEIGIAPPPGTPLLAGLTAKVRIARTVPAAGAVPLAAVVEGDGRSGAVFAVEDGRARRVPVSIAFLDGDRAVLSGGVEGLAAVVGEGAARLSDGAPVRVAR
jgi:RND family efflux transporter MFP subunit